MNGLSHIFFTELQMVLLRIRVYPEPVRSRKLCHKWSIFPLESEPRFFALLLPSVCRNARGYSSRSTYSLEKAFPTASGCSKSSLRSLSKSTTREAHTGCCGVLITPSHRCRCWYSLFQLPFSPRVPPHANDKLTAPRSFHRQPRGRPFLRLSERAHILPYESGTHLLNRPPGLSRIPL